MKFARGFKLLFLISFFCICAPGQVLNKDQAVEVRFDFPHNEIVMQVRIDGKGPFNMLLDTGTDPSAIDLATAKVIGLKLRSTGHKGSGGGTDVNLAYETKFSLIEVATLTAKNVDAAAIDLSRISERMGIPIHGVLGQSFLKDRIVQIDYPHGLVRFVERSPFSKTPGQPNGPTFTTVPFRYKDNVLIDGILVNGKPLTASLDTGSSGTFDLSPAAVTLLGLDDEASKGKVNNSVGYNGKFENHAGKLMNVTIGGISTDAPDVIFFAKGTGHDKVPWGINIGNVFLKNFVLTLDYRSKTITFQRP